MKFVKKSDLTYREGYLVNSEGNIMDVPTSVVWGLNHLETLEQKAAYARSKKQTIEEPKEFQFLNEHDIAEIKFNVDTPHIDAKIAQSLGIIEEVKAMGAIKEMERIADLVMSALRWVHNESFVSEEADTYQDRFNLATIGNPLNLTLDECITIIADYVSAEYGVEMEEKSDEDEQ